MKKELLCIQCPLGCHLLAETDADGKISITGNACKNGEAYAISECTDPRRTLTTILNVEGGAIPIAVRTEKPVSKDRIFDCLCYLRALKAPRGTKTGGCHRFEYFGYRCFNHSRRATIGTNSVTETKERAVCKKKPRRAGFLRKRRKKKFSDAHVAGKQNFTLSDWFIDTLPHLAKRMGFFILRANWIGMPERWRWAPYRPR